MSVRGHAQQGPDGIERRTVRADFVLSPLRVAIPPIPPTIPFQSLSAARALSGGSAQWVSENSSQSTRASTGLKGIDHVVHLVFFWLDKNTPQSVRDQMSQDAVDDLKDIPPSNMSLPENPP